MFFPQNTRHRNHTHVLTCHSNVPAKSAIQTCLSSVQFKRACQVCHSNVPVKRAIQTCLSSVPFKRACQACHSNVPVRRACQACHTIRGLLPVDFLPLSVQLKIHTDFLVRATFLSSNDTAWRQRSNSECMRAAKKFLKF